MEQKISITDGGYPNADIAVPSSLISVHPFLEDSRRNLWWCSNLTLWSLLPSFHANNEVYHILINSHARNVVTNPALHLRRKRVAFACINHAFKVTRGYIELHCCSLLFIPLHRCMLTKADKNPFQSWHIRTIAQLVNILNMEWDTDAMRCLDSFRVIRDSLSGELNLPVDQEYVLQGNVLRQPFPSHEIIIAEVYPADWMSLSYLWCHIRCDHTFLF